MIDTVQEKMEKSDRGRWWDREQKRGIKRQVEREKVREER